MNPGDQLDHYRIESVASHGSTSDVYKGTNLRTNQGVAIKLPHPEMEGDPTFLERFHREQEIGKTLNHQGVNRVVSDGLQSRAYIVTEWFAGLTLREILTTQAKLPRERSVSIALKVCDALGYIHGHGIFHRNLKPENILVGENDEIKLTGLEFAAVEGAPRITFTSLAQLVGASPYISPEELTGKRGDARSDLYSVGVILYEMLTGALPFGGADAYDRLKQYPIPPRELDPSITPQLQEVLYRALERHHKDRYPSAHDFAHDLRHLDQVGVAQRQEIANWKRQKNANRRKVLLLAAVLLLPALIFALLLCFGSK
jgi:eukaryotic-like serine/threonine-protein kinase